MNTNPFVTTLPANTQRFHLLTLLHMCRCSQLQAASAGCSACSCAVTNTCTRALLATAGCTGCQAYPVEFCRDFLSNRTIIGIIVSNCLLQV